MRKQLRAALLIGVTLSLPVLALTIEQIPATPAADRCRVEARLLGPISNLGQYLLEIRVPDHCPRDERRFARIITKNGGRIPPLGYFPLSQGFPRKVTYWVFPGAIVQDCTAPNVWRAVPLKGAPAASAAAQ